MEKHEIDYQPVFAAQVYVVADVLHHVVELQSQVACHVERAQIVFKRDAAILPVVPLQRIEHHEAEAVYEPCLQADVGRMVLKRCPVVLHQVDGILVGKRHEVHVFLLAQTVALVEDCITGTTVVIEIIPDDVAVAIAQPFNYLRVGKSVMRCLAVSACSPEVHVG